MGSRHFTYSNSFKTHNNSIRWALLYSFSRWGYQDTTGQWGPGFHKKFTDN